LCVYREVAILKKAAAASNTPVEKVVSYDEKPASKVQALVKDRHRSREFVEFLKLLGAAYPAHTAIKLILDNHSAHISKETKAWLAAQPAGRFEFTFTPKHGVGSTLSRASSPSSPAPFRVTSA
jgi:hypothetical protein